MSGQGERMAATGLDASSGRAPLPSGSGLVKICGLTDEPGLDAALRAGADMVGLVFVAASPRHVTSARAAPLAERARGEAAVVGLFQNAALSDIEAVLERVPLDLVQLHGAEDEAAASRVASAFGLPVVRAFGVAGRADLYRAAGFPAALAIYDARPPRGAGASGGHGAAFDWRLLDAAAERPPWLLAGGLTPDNVAGAVLACRGRPGFAGVDVSSGVEAARGVKDPALVTRFVAAARAAMSAPTDERPARAVP